MTESVSIQNQFGFAVGPDLSFTPQPGGSKETHYVPSILPTTQSEVGLNYTATADSSGFFFLHDNYCVGSCSTFSQTIITFTLHNDGDSPVDLRFDSQITPGHLARIAGNARMSGAFDFTVVQQPVLLSAAAATEATTLYSAAGGVNSDGIFLATGNLPFNGMTRTSDPEGGWEVLDWSTTNLNLQLATLGAGATTQVIYTARYNTLATADCTDVRDCQGLQVVFGDPRNNGGVSTIAALLAPTAADPLYPVIGRDYDPHRITADFVPIDTPLPPTPPVLPQTNYGPLFDPRVVGVPEPAMWAMMIGGFGLVGGTLRRRRRDAVQSGPFGRLRSA